jgi:hypothetical protein
MKLFEIQNYYNNVQFLLEFCEKNQIDDVDIQYALFDNLQLLEPEIDKIRKLMPKRLQTLIDTAWNLSNDKKKELYTQEQLAESPQLKEFGFDFGKSFFSEKENAEYEKLNTKYLNDLNKEREIKVVLFDRNLLRKFKMLPTTTQRFIPFMTKTK